MLHWEDSSRLHLGIQMFAILLCWLSAILLPGGVERSPDSCGVVISCGHSLFSALNLPHWGRVWEQRQANWCLAIVSGTQTALKPCCLFRQLVHLSMRGHRSHCQQNSALEHLTWCIVEVHKICRSLSTFLLALSSLFCHWQDWDLTLCEAAHHLSWFVQRGKVSRASPASRCWRPRWRNISEQGAGKWEGERGSLPGYKTVLSV